MADFQECIGESSTADADAHAVDDFVVFLKDKNGGSLPPLLPI